MALAGSNGRDGVYARLMRRNRVVAALRLGVPVLGAITLVALVGQIYLSSLGERYGIGRLSVTPDAITVEAPEYAGVLEDGSHYRVFADAARAATSNTDLIGLSNAAVVLNRADGVQMEAFAARAELDALRQQVLVPGRTEIADSQGTQGALSQSVFDWQSQTLTTSGPVEIDYADGTAIRAEGLVYDAQAKIWTFARAIVTLPATPGEVLP
ncbi:MAG: LPS export ABC transporter periplasmic protein LptC [Devosia sp.]|nr:LPS export ABC transporter periplasmic protein LptC [Devosia sp.]